MLRKFVCLSLATSILGSLSSVAMADDNWTGKTESEKIELLYNKIKTQEQTISALKNNVLTKDTAIPYTYSSEGKTVSTPAGQSLEGKLQHLTFSDNHRGYAQAVLVGINNDYMPPSPYVAVGDSIMFGINNYDTGLDNLIVGNDAQSFGREGIAIGYQAANVGQFGTTTGAFSMTAAMLSNGQLYGTNTAYGFNSTSAFLGSTYGPSSITTQPGGIAIGALAVVNGDPAYKNDIKNNQGSSGLHRGIYEAYAKNHGGVKALDEEVKTHYKSILDKLDTSFYKTHEDDILWNFRTSYVLEKLGNRATKGVAIGYNSYTGVPMGIALGADSEVERPIATIKGYLTEDTPIDENHVRGALSIGSEGVYRQIIHVADGYEDFDAVNVRQLKKLEEKLGKGIQPTPEPVPQPTPQPKPEPVPQPTPQPTPQPVPTITVVGSDSIAVTKEEGASTYLVKLKDEVKAKSFVVRDGSKEGPQLTVEGIDSKHTKIRHVADGTEASDAVNLGQLQQALSNIHVDGLKQYSDKGDALGAALTALKPLGYDPTRPWEIMAGLGGYKGEKGVAIGLAYHSSRDTLFHGGAAFGGTSTMWNVGLSLRLGKEHKESLDKLRNHKDYVLYTVRALQEEQEGTREERRLLEARVATLEKENKELEKRLAQLEGRMKS